MNPEQLDILESKSKGGSGLLNPFPGLRPFTFDESHLFFGREGQSEEILANLAKHRFTAVIGTSGSGKSSLMYCGILPILYSGFSTKSGSEWSVIPARPGIAPLKNLAEAILSNDDNYNNASEQEKVLQQRNIAGLMRNGPMGLVEAVKLHAESSQKNTLILIDQFEELFRYIGVDREDEQLNESATYVNLLLKSISQSEVPIYVAFTMRSDFIGDCSQYPELTHLINKSNYLIPRMTREQQRKAIHGPVAIGGGTITDRLVEQLLDEVGSNLDQLPVMQHAMMRTWDYWKTNREADEPIDLHHYIAIGKINEALSQHANEAYAELDKKEKQICEVIFKVLTEKGADNKGVRRAARLQEIIAITGAEEQEIIGIINKFREPGRSLLTPAAHVSLTSSSLIEISHESLMRIWLRLKNWVEEEAESAQMYKRLSEAAERYQVGKTGLWRPPDLHLALNWQEKQKPTQAWAARYNPVFERAMVFLNLSKEEYESEQKGREILERRKHQQTRMVSLILGMAAVIAIIFFVFGFMMKINADGERERAENNAILAEQNAAEAQRNAEDADQQKLNAQIERDSAEYERERASRSAQIAMEEQRRAEEEKIRADEQRAVAEEQRILADRGKHTSDSLRDVADEKTTYALEQTKIAEREQRNADKLRMISIAQSMAVKSLNIDDVDVKAALAFQAYLFNTEYGGKPYDNYIYDGLYYAKRDKLKQSQNIDLYRYQEHKGTLRSIVYAPDGRKFFTTGSDGNILKWDAADYTFELLYQSKQDYINHAMQVSPDGKWLAVGGDAPYILVIDLQNSSATKLEGHQGMVTDLMFMPDSDSFLSYSIQERSLRMNTPNDSREIVQFNQRYTALSLSRDGKLLVAGNEKGQLDIFNAENFNKIKSNDKLLGSPIYAIAFSPDNRTIAVGNENGIVALGVVIEDDVRITSGLPGQQSRINSIKFSDDGNLIATASLDGSVQLWVISEMDKMLPVVFTDHNDYVWSIEFSKDSNFLLAGTKDGVLKLWPTRPDILADNMCLYLHRNLTPTEWDRYVGEGVEYVKACEDAGFSHQIE